MEIGIFQVPFIKRPQANFRRLAFSTSRSSSESQGGIWSGLKFQISMASFWNPSHKLEILKFNFHRKEWKKNSPKLCQLERQEKRLRLFWPIRALFEPVSALAALLVVHFLLFRVISGNAPPYGITFTQQLNICRNRSFNFHLHRLQIAMIGFYIIESICIQWHLTNQDKQPQTWIDHIRDILECVNIKMRSALDAVIEDIIELLTVH